MATATLTARRNQNLYRQPTTLKLGPISSSFVTVSIIGLLAGLYLNQVTKTNVLGIRVGELAKQSRQLLADKQDLSVEAARLQAIGHIAASAGHQGLVAESKVTYAR